MFYIVNAARTSHRNIAVGGGGSGVGWEAERRKQVVQVDRG